MEPRCIAHMLCTRTICPPANADSVTNSALVKARAKTANTHLGGPDARPVVVEELGHEVDVYGVVRLQLIAQRRQRAEGGRLGPTKSEVAFQGPILCSSQGRQVLLRFGLLTKILHCEIPLISARRWPRLRSWRPACPPKSSSSVPQELL